MYRILLYEIILILSANRCILIKGKIILGISAGCLVNLYNVDTVYT